MLLERSVGLDHPLLVTPVPDAPLVVGALQAGPAAQVDQVDDGKSATALATVSVESRDKKPRESDSGKASRTR